MSKVPVVIVDDHAMFRRGIAELIGQFPLFEVIADAAHGKELIQLFKDGIAPQLVVLDVQMPVMDGEATAKWMRANHPEIKVVALTMMDDEKNIIKMVKAGARGYVLKSSEPNELEFALNQIMEHGYYHSNFVTTALMRGLGKGYGEHGRIELTDREKDFLGLVVSDLTYKEIADKLSLPPRTIDTIRDELFEKLQTRSRVGLALFAVKNQLADI